MVGTASGHGILMVNQGPFSIELLDMTLGERPEQNDVRVQRVALQSVLPEKSMYMDHIGGLGTKCPSLFFSRNPQRCQRWRGS